MLDFFYHYFTICSWNQEWFDIESDSIWDQIRKNENPTGVVWKYSDAGIPMTFHDILEFVDGRTTPQFKNWIRFILSKCSHLDDNTSVMSSMGCGSSDYLLMGKIRKWVEDHSEVASLNDEYRTSEEWYNELDKSIGLIILDPDGWDRSNYYWSFNQELVTADEYKSRLQLSTISYNFNKIRL